MRTTLLAALVAVPAASLSGCLVLGAAAVAAGVVHTTSDDSSEVTLEHSWERVFSEGVAELEEQGSVDVRDEDAGRIEGHAQSASVVIRMHESTENTVSVVVTARKLEGFSPAPDVSERIAWGITRRLGH